ncbi:MAG: hypothetical protein RLZZ451_1565 [Pseudomonadota bacterium]|jgi:hypothetical protein
MAAEFMDSTALRAAVAPAGPGCPHCAALRAPGWESVAAPVGEPLLACIGTLRDPAVDEPTVLERHAPGTGYWHARARVVPTHFPYNRCTVWRCPQCRRGFLQYTEAGGYYVDHRLRELDPTLIED